MNKKGQGLSLNVIIIAALALIVLVVLIMVFTGRIGIFERGVGQESQAELVQLKVTYGDCRPSVTMEARFLTELNTASSLEGKEEAKAKFKEEISRCKSFRDKDDCESEGCKWG